MRIPVLIVISILLLCGGCNRVHYPTSLSTEYSRKCGLLTAEFVPAASADLGAYALEEMWAEEDSEWGQRLVVRLNGPDDVVKPIVHILGFENAQYITVWSHRDGSVYQVWDAPDPLPKQITLVREGKQVPLLVRDDEILIVDSASPLDILILPAFVILSAVIAGIIPPMLRLYSGRGWRVPLSHCFLGMVVAASLILIVNEFSSMHNTMPVFNPSGTIHSSSILPDILWLLITTAPVAVPVFVVSLFVTLLRIESANHQLDK